MIVYASTVAELTRARKRQRPEDILAANQRKRREKQAGFTERHQDVTIPCALPGFCIYRLIGRGASRYAAASGGLWGSAGLCDT